MRWIIRSKDGFWNNDLGWVESYLDADRFTDDEKGRYDLPIGGSWSRLYNHSFI